MSCIIVNSAKIENGLNGNISIKENVAESGRNNETMTQTSDSNGDISAKNE